MPGRSQCYRPKSYFRPCSVNIDPFRRNTLILVIVVASRGWIANISFLCFSSRKEESVPVRGVRTRLRPEVLAEDARRDRPPQDRRLQVRRLRQGLLDQADARVPPRLADRPQQPRQEGGARPGDGSRTTRLACIVSQLWNLCLSSLKGTLMTYEKCQPRSQSLPDTSTDPIWHKY